MSAVSQEEPQTAPALQQPGAGLPWWELLVARRIIFPLSCRRLTWASAKQLFQDEGAKVLALWDALPAEQLTTRKLIRRIAGIEDSSRFWSVAMTVEHLNIVGVGIRRTIAGLRRGELPARAARVEDVKPRGEMEPTEVRRRFIQLLGDAAADESPPMLQAEGLRAAHPWFGPITGFQWHCLLGLHQTIHRKQIEAIRAALPRD